MSRVMPPDTDDVPAVANILLVDDREENLVALEAILSSAGHRLVAVRSGREALAALLREEFALVLLDVVMPEIGGFEVADQMKKIERTRHVPIIFLTAHAPHIEQIYEGYSIGAVDYLVKPLDSRAVRSKVGVFVDLFRQRKEVERQARLLREADRREHDRRLTELRLAGDERYQKLIEGIDHTVAWSALPDTQRLTFVSQRMPALLESTTEEIVEPGAWLRRVHPDDREGFLATMGEVLAGGGDRTATHRVVTGSGGVLWFRTALSVVRNERGEPEVHGVSTDVTALKRAEHVQSFLAEATSRLTQSLAFREVADALARIAVPELSDVCLVHAVTEGELELLSVQAVLASDADVLRTSLPRSQRPSAAGEAGDAGIGAVLETGRALLQTEVADPGWLEQALGAQDGRSFEALAPISCMIVPLRARDRLVAIATLLATASGRRFQPADLRVAQDLASRAALAIDNARLFERAESATRAREDMLAVVSHDLRSPLSSVLLGAEALERTTREDAALAQIRPIASTIQRAARRMERLVGDLVDFQQIALKRLRIERSSEAASSLVAAAVEVLEPLAREASVRLVADVEDVGGVDVLCDRDRILQVFSNLVGNAIRFSAPGSMVSVRARVSSGAVEFSVADHGPGISPDQLPQVFTRFWQAKGKGRGGLGLGLAIAKGIVDAHGGAIWAESAVCVGSTFFFTLPILRKLEVGRGPSLDRGNGRARRAPA